MTIIMLVWCIWLSVCVSGSDPPPFPVGGLDLPVGTGNPSWCIVCVCPCRAWKVQDSSCDAPAMVRASFWSFEGLEFGRKRLGCQTWSGVLRRNGRWLRQHFQELGVSSAGVCWTLLWFGVLGVELVFNSVAGFSGGVSCPSEVRVFTVLWEQGEAVLFSGADLFSLSLPFCLTASQADSGSSSFSHWFSWDHFSQCRPGERWRPRGPSHRSYLCSGRVSACESRSLLDGGAFHSLCGGLALSWRWVPSRASSWCCVLKSRTAGVFVLFSEAIFCL